VTESLSLQAEAALGDVVEGAYPLCRVGLTIHDGRACCPCGGCSYRVDHYSLLLSSCPDHPAKDCEHWQALWRLRDRPVI
jgi:hypothetical protein